MFTGLISEVTEVKKSRPSNAGLLLTLVKPKGWSDLKEGESVDTDGACLTVSAVRQAEYDCMLVPETLQKTTFGKSIPKAVNLERSLQAGDRFGGHFVQGHVDTTSKVIEIDASGDWRVRFVLPQNSQNLVINKGSITINGVSLTITNVKPESFGVVLIPHTLEHTTLGQLKVGDLVNLEFDIIGKYILRGMENAKSRTGKL